MRGADVGARAAHEPGGARRVRDPPAPSGSSSALGSSSLPFTGTDVIELDLIALVLLAVGWALARRRRTVS